ncbi:hypothetical protein PsYK624_089740 [Phanerochaete sordida]|uniref:Uncharacterized protein n=1 Tax=Phanerochaete sordida TaxID=48140 RepID=A0A9P3LG84_9APHY|nr:hypothetical protein PsYK624_089740 [Phanerochaete sordida]
MSTGRVTSSLLRSCVLARSDHWEAYHQVVDFILRHIRMQPYAASAGLAEPRQSAPVRVPAIGTWRHAFATSWRSASPSKMSRSAHSRRS